MMHDIDSLCVIADRSGQKEYRCDCPYCSKHPEHFATRNVHDLEREREKRTSKFNQIRDVLTPISDGDLAAQYLYHRLGTRPPNAAPPGLRKRFNRWFIHVPSLIDYLENESSLLKRSA